MTATVLIVEDHGLLAQSLSFALRADGLDVEVCAPAAHDDVLEAAARVGPDVVLLDLDLGDEVGSAVPVIAPLAAEGARVVMVTGVTDRARLAECVEAGAVGLISKAEPFERLVRGVHEALDGGTLLAPGERHDLLAALRRHRREQAERLRAFQLLTPREGEVLAALVDGRSAEQIAKASFVSLATVRTQIRSILQKLGVHSQLEAVAMARRSGWRPPA